MDNDEMQSNMDMALEMAKLLNDCCDSVADVKSVFDILSGILSIRFGCIVSFEVKPE